MTCGENNRIRAFSILFQTLLGAQLGTTKQLSEAAARFDFTIAAELHTLCRQQSLDSIASERVVVEFEKAWFKSLQPSVAIQHLVDLQVIEKYFGSWPGLDSPLILSALNRGRNYLKDDPGWDMGLFWAIALSQASTEEATAILDRLQIHSFHRFNIRCAVLATLQPSLLLSQEDSISIRNHAAEDCSLDFLTTVSHSLYPDGFASINRQKAEKETILYSPLPRLLQGRDLVTKGLQGKQIGNCLSFVRSLELSNIITTKSEALSAAQRWINQQ